MDLRFARSRRRAELRRREPPRRSPAAWRSVRAVVLAGLMFAVVGESAREISNARGGGTMPAKATPAAIDPSCPIPARFRSAFTGASAKTGLPLSLLVAVAYEESRMNQQARSHAGANGLLQLMPATARALDSSWQRADSNVLGGARYLRQLLNRFGSLDLALAAYNAGPTAVQKAAAAPTVQTLRYVKNVEARAAGLGACDY